MISTHKGLYRYTRLPYGVSSAPGIFQKVMEQLLQGIPGVTVYIDDILVTGETVEDHLNSLEEVLKRLAKAELRAKREKCKFLVPSVSYLGHLIDSEGLHPLPSKVKAIHDAPTPRNVQELKAYLGLLTYYGKFLPNLTTVLAPLYELLRKNQHWKWYASQSRAFQKSKELLTSAALLVHFDPTLPLVLACDASQYGIGAVLAHKLLDGSERPIGYASRSLNAAEKNYSQLEKEGLACVFGVKRFFSYLFGHTFQLITDHKPLLGLLSEGKPASPQASARVRRWSLYLSMFEYHLTFRNTSAHANADALSRLPLPTQPALDQPPPELVLLADHLSNSPVTAKHIQVQTNKDVTLATALQYALQGWPNRLEPHSALQPYFERRTELSVFQGCLLWGSRVVVPAACRQQVLEQLHEGHPGITRMKRLARMYVWWPGISSAMEEMVRSCQSCQLQQSTPAPAPMQPWSWPTRPWARLHLDYAGPIEGKMILVLIDAHSKWIEAMVTPTSTSTVVIEELRDKFSQFGIPETIVTDNGPCFTSAEFELFLEKNGVKHTTTAPYHPASNGLAERAVQIVKKGLKKCKDGTLRTRLSRMLFAYRLTPQGTTAVSPAELLLNRRPRSRLDLLRPNLPEQVERRQEKQKSYHDRRTKEREFAVGASVWVRNPVSGDKWLPGVVLSKEGSVNYQVELNTGRVRKCHVEQMRTRTVSSTETVPSETPLISPSIGIPEQIVPSTSVTEPPVVSAPCDEPRVLDSTPNFTEHTESTSVEPSVEPNTELRSSTRNRKPVNRYEPKW